MSTSVFPLTTHSSNHPSKTPATNKHLSFNLQRTLQKTAGSKPKHFEIYVDRHSKPETSPHHPIRAKAHRERSPTKPLEDKTNTSRKDGRRPEAERLRSPSGKPYNADEGPKKPSSSLAFLTPHRARSAKPAPLHPSSPPRNDPSKPLLYRTPVTSKRPARPPITLPFDLAPDEFDPHPELSCGSPDQSLQVLGFDLAQLDIPDVEYGPPSAIIEPIESLLEHKEHAENAHQTAEFFGTLRPNASNYLISDGESGAQLGAEIEEIMRTDGSKARWTYESECEMTSYAVDELLDEFVLPAARKPQPAPAASRRPASKPSSLVAPRAKAPPPRQSSRLLAKAPAAAAPLPAPRVAPYHALVLALRRLHHAALLADLHSLHAGLPPSPDHTLDHELDAFQLELVA